MKRLYVIILTALLSAPAWGAITINFSDMGLYTASGSSLAPSGSLVIVGASTTDTTFNEPSPTAFFIGDDIEIARGTVGPDGMSFFALNTAVYSGQWNVGDPLQVYWYPSLTGGAANPGAAGVNYGKFRTDAVIDGSTWGWVSPSDGASGSLNFFTSTYGGSNPDTAGYADLAVVPEPGAYMGVFGALSLLGGIFIRWLKKS